MQRKQIITVLRTYGLEDGRCIAASKTGYCKCHTQHFVVFNAQVFSHRGRILKQVDLDLTLDAEKLNAAARTAGENFYVLYENRPHLGWKPKSGPMIPLLRDAVWWTRIRPQDQDVFLPMDSVRGRPNRVRLECSTGQWQGKPAYGVDVWLNPAWDNMNMSGAVIELNGHPPEHLHVSKRVKRGDEFTREPCLTRGRAVRPVFHQKSGCLEYVWFSNGVAVPTVLYDNSVGLLDDLTFTCHASCEAIHIRRHGKVIGLIWPCSIHAPGVVASARAELKSRSRAPEK
jgi:hypothetical protein